MEPKNSHQSYPEPFVVEARRAHRHSLILLHGRGSNGKQFGEELLASHTSILSSPTVAAALPDTKFIFPTASKRRAKWYNRATINQWFDNVPLDQEDAGTSREQEEWQLEGLQQGREFLKGVVDEEVSQVGASNVFVGGLSQGCAMSLHFLLSHVGQLGGFVGMSGWLPFVDDMEGILHPKEDELGGDNPFALSGADEDSSPLASFHEPETLSGEQFTQCPAAVIICNFVRDIMDLQLIPESHEPLWLHTPVFLGHGLSDEKVRVVKGRKAANFLKDLGMQVTWKEYDEGHWYKVPEEARDIVAFLQDKML